MSLPSAWALQTYGTPLHPPGPASVGQAGYSSSPQKQTCPQAQGSQTDQPVYPAPVALFPILLAFIFLTLDCTPVFPLNAPCSRLIDVLDHDPALSHGPTLFTLPSWLWSQPVLMGFLLSTSITSAFLQFQLVHPASLATHIGYNMFACLFMSPSSEDSGVS